MPGFFGGVGEVADSLDRLGALFRRIWQPVRQVTLEGGGLGGHAFEGEPVIGVEGRAIARDGDGGAFAKPRAARETGAAGVVAEVDGIRKRAVLLTDPSGVYPLFYHDSGAGLLFSTHLKPLASAIGASPHFAAVSQYLRFGYIHAGETVFEGIRRLQPGQRLSWSPEDGAKLEETSRLWTEIHDFATPEEAAEEVAPLLREAVDRRGTASSPGVLMMSAGWDSRTLLAAARQLEDAGLAAFSHGDTRSRELHIVERICESLGMPWRSECIDAAVWDSDHLDTCFRRTESLVFPHWARAGALLGGSVSHAFSGVLGEVLGGHYGETHLSSGFLGKATSLLRTLRAPSHRKRPPLDQVDGGTVRDRLRLSRLDRPWYLNPEVEGDSREVMTLINERIDSDLSRLERRGVTSWDLLLEAAITETRGVQYICAQPLSMRTGVDIAIPFAQTHLLEMASRIPSSLKVHNRVNRLLVRRLRPELERFPMAATLVPASWPLLVQEGSRAARRVIGDAVWALHHMTRGRIPHPRLGWVNFDFLRAPGLLERVFDSLSLDIWDLSALEAVARKVKDEKDLHSLHPLYDQTGKILTVDRMLRVG